MTTLSNRVISLSSRKTSMRLTEFEWEVLAEICRNEKIKRRYLLDFIDKNRDPCIGLTPSVRLFEISYLYKKSQFYAPNILFWDKNYMKEILAETRR